MFFARTRQTAVLRTEPGRGGAFVAYLIMVVLLGLVVAVAITYRTAVWPVRWRLPVPVPSGARTIVEIVGAGLLLLAAAAASVNGRRWALARRVRRLSDDPRLSPFHKPELAVAPRRVARSVGPLVVRAVRPRKLPGVSGRHVTSSRNVVGRRPVDIVYLRLFENQPRARTFLQGAWREFGRVHLLRSAYSVTPAEERAWRRAGPGGPFISSRDELRRALAASGGHVDPWGLRTFRSIGAATIRTFDRFGGYPPRALLVHGAFWKEAVAALVDEADLVVLDLSGLTERNKGTLYELQLVVDTVPIERVVLLADPNSHLGYLAAQLRSVWQTMAETSPNAGPGEREAVVYRTDRWVRSGGQTGSAGQAGHTTTPERIRLTAVRRQSRRIAAYRTAHVV